MVYCTPTIIHSLGLCAGDISIHVCACVRACVRVRASMQVCGCICVHGSLIKMCSNLLAFDFCCAHRIFNHVSAMEHHLFIMG